MTWKMAKYTCFEISDCFEATMGMLGKTGNIVVGVVAAKLIQQ